MRDRNTTGKLKVRDKLISDISPLEGKTNLQKKCRFQIY